MAKNNYKYLKNKYNNKSCKCKLGHIHDSRGEARYWGFHDTETN